MQIQDISKSSRLFPFYIGAFAKIRSCAIFGGYRRCNYTLNKSVGCVAGFLQFSHSNALTMLCNIHYSSFVPLQGTRWIIYHTHTKMRTTQPSQPTFDRLGRISLSTPLTVDFTLECNNKSIFHPLPHVA